MDRDNAVHGEEGQDRLDSIRESFERMDKSELIDMMVKLYSVLETKKDLLVPVSLFRHEELSAFEIIVLFLKDVKHYRISEISGLTGRNNQAVWITERNAREKLRGELSAVPSPDDFPLAVIADRKYSILESIVNYYLGKGMTLTVIGRLLSRDTRTIWTIASRIKVKIAQDKIG